MMWDIVGLILLWLVLLMGFLVIPFGVAGTFIMVAAAAVYGLATQFQRFSPWFLGILLVIALFAELVEFLLGTVTTLTFGATKWGVLGAMGGGILGGIWGTAVLPLVGTLLGALLGAFIGAMGAELAVGGDERRAARAGAGAFVGRLGGLTTKLGCAVAMMVIIGLKVF